VSHHPAFLYAPGLQEGNQESHTMTTYFFQFSKGVGAEATESGESASSVFLFHLCLLGKKGKLTRQAIE